MSIVATIANADQFVRMVSGPSGGSWYPLGAKVMQTLESNINGISTSNTSGGGISNVMSVNGGDAEIGWSYAHTVANGWNSKGKFLSYPDHHNYSNQDIQKIGKDLFHFLSELGWREFSYYLLYHFPEITNKNFNTTFDNYPWSSVTSTFDAWKRGRTGVPIVDAGMRELWETGYIHNRARMIVGSYLVKNLNIDWRDGEEWFWDCLVDADLAANCASWQWVAGSGADAAPFFRIFNPILQGEKFDKDGNYVRKYCPEISKLPNKYLHQPWEAPEEIISESERVLGKDYPTPIVDLKESRKDALNKYNIMRSA